MELPGQKLVGGCWGRRRGDHWLFRVEKGPAVKEPWQEAEGAHSPQGHRAVVGQRAMTPTDLTPHRCTGVSGPRWMGLGAKSV